MTTTEILINPNRSASEPSKRIVRTPTNGESNRRLSAPSATSAPQESARVGQRTRPVSSRRRHAAKGARVTALVLSLAATGGLTTMFAAADRADAAISTKSASSKTTTAAAAAVKTAKFTGDSLSGKWGAVQVQITVSNGKITAAPAIVTPASKSKSVRINQQAVPILQSEALSVQSANINSVSGATYTSDRYEASLQSAIDRAVAAGALVTA
jgi:uncharacterized protein with FMN-binding domain